MLDCADQTIETFSGGNEKKIDEYSIDETDALTSGSTPLSSEPCDCESGMHTTSNSVDHLVEIAIRNLRPISICRVNQVRAANWNAAAVLVLL